MQPIFRSRPVLDLLLNRENPRHVEKDTQEEVIEYLVADEEVYNLARHMALNGINPLEVTAVFPDEDGNLIVAEGNRRVCAAQLLTDPQKAPEKSRARFKALSSEAQDVSAINTAEFPDYATAQPWLQVLHDGEQDGVGRKRWKPEQKARATTGKSKDALAVALLDYAQAQGIVAPEARARIRVSTITRYLANPSVRHAMGVTAPATSTKVTINSTVDRFHGVLTDFVEGVETKRLHSRSVTKDWMSYSAELVERFGDVRPGGVERELSASSPVRRFPRKGKARIVAPDTRYIEKSDALVLALNVLGSAKLSNLYASLIGLRLDEHPVLLTAGAWMFLETLTALHGRVALADFTSYTMSKLGGWGIPKDVGKECKLSLEYVSQHGNAHKHSGKFAAVDARNLHNHFEVLEVVLVKLIEDCSKMKKKP